MDDVPAPVVAGGGGRRRLAVGVLALVLVLGAGVANRISAGGAGVADEQAVDDTTTTVAPRRTTTSDQRPPRTTTTVPDVLTTVATVGPLIPEPVGTTLVLANANQLFIAHLDTGTVRTVRVPSPDLGGPFQSVLPVGDALLVGGNRPQLVARGAGGEVRDAGGTASGGLLPSAVAGRCWSVDWRFQLELTEQGIGGELTRRLELPGDGGAVLTFGDGFLVSPFETIMAIDATTGRGQRVGDGAAVAVNADSLVRSRCDEALECGLVITDLAGGNERVVGPPTPRSRYETYSGARFSPDGRWLVAPFYGEDQPGGLVLIDVEQGIRRPTDLLTTVSGGGFPANATFTADSRWLLVGEARGGGSRGGAVKAIRIADGVQIDLDLDLDLDLVLGPRVGDSPMAMVALPSIPADAER